MFGLGAPKFRILTFWMAPWKTLKTSLKRCVSTHFQRPWAGGHKSLFQDGEYATFLSQFFHHRFLRCKPCWISRITLQMCSEHASHDTEAGLGAPGSFVNRFVTLFSEGSANSLSAAFFQHHFLRCKPLWIPRITLQMCSED